MPPSRIWVLPIWIWSPSRIFGTPVMSAARAIVGSRANKIAKLSFMDMNGRMQWEEDRRSDCGVDLTGALAQVLPAPNLTREGGASSSGPPTLTPAPRHHDAPRERQP